MGLDISFYKNLKFVRRIDEDDDGTEFEKADAENLIVLYVNSDFPYQADSLINSGAYSFEEKSGFRAGSYGYYNHWRNRLAILAGYKGPADLWDGRVTEGPFYELINFSDCEGVIGAEVSEKLYQDFVDFDTKARHVVGEVFYGQYQKWSIAFEMARHNGCVSFH